MAYKLLGSSTTAADSAGAASNLGRGTFIYTLASAAGVTVTIVEDDSGSTLVGSIAVPNGTPVILKKDGNQEVYASSTSCKFTSIGLIGE
tara:strand:- start:3245 stop:3514 length:270 start_codon:yes stop_codon:yes gene_type:complete